MTRIFSYLTFLFFQISVSAWAQNAPSAADRFFDFLNNYQIDSLQNLLTDDFQLKRTYTTYTNDKTSFLEQYVPVSKNYNGKYKILNVISAGEPQQFLVEDRSDYLTYLNVAYPTWKMTITTGQNKISQVTLDTKETYAKYLADIRVADERFMAWLNAHYPQETRDMLEHQDGLLGKRLKEYADQKK